MRLVPKGLARETLNNQLSTTKLIFKAASGPIDPIQQLYADKVVQYGSKKKETAAIFVDGTQKDEESLKEELDKIAQTFGGGKGIDMVSFPSLRFKEPSIDTTDSLSEEIFFVKGISEEDQMKNEVINLKSQVTRLNQERDELLAKIDEEERKTIESVTKFETDKEELANKLSMAIEKNARMEKELLGKDELVAEIQAWQKDVLEIKEKSKSEIEYLNITLAEVKSSLAESDKDINQLEAEKETLTNSLALARQEKAKVEQDFKGTVAEVSELKASKEEILNDNSTLKANATELDAKMKGLQNEISTLTDVHETEKAGLQSKLKVAQSANNELQNSIDALKNELNSLKSNNEAGKVVEEKIKKIEEIENKPEPSTSKDDTVSTENVDVKKTKMAKKKKGKKENNKDKESLSNA